MSEERRAVDELITTLKQMRDEIKLKVHLANSELKGEWNKLDDRYQQLVKQYNPAKEAAAEASAGIWQSLKSVGEEIRTGFKKIRDAL